MRRNKNIVIVLIVLIILLVSLVSWNHYIDSNTEFVYGKIPNEAVPEDYDQIEYTIPIIDEDGNRGTQTFTINNNEDVGEVVKLHVRKDKVRKYEFITEKELPKTVKNNL